MRAKLYDRLLSVGVGLGERSGRSSIKLGIKITIRTLTLKI